MLQNVNELVIFNVAQVFFRANPNLYAAIQNAEQSHLRAEAIEQISSQHNLGSLLEKFQHSVRVHALTLCAVQGVLQARASVPS